MQGDVVSPTLSWSRAAQDLYRSETARAVSLSDKVNLRTDLRDRAHEDATEHPRDRKLTFRLERREELPLKIYSGESEGSSLGPLSEGGERGKRLESGLRIWPAPSVTVLKFFLRCLKGSRRRGRDRRVEELREIEVGPANALREVANLRRCPLQLLHLLQDALRNVDPLRDPSRRPRHD